MKRVMNVAMRGRRFLAIVWFVGIVEWRGAVRSGLGKTWRGSFRRFWDLLGPVGDAMAGWGSCWRNPSPGGNIQ